MKLWKRIRYLLNREAFDRDLQEEMRVHREMAEEKLSQLGTPKEEAHYAAMRAFGNATLAQEASRAEWTFFFATLVQDIRFGVRMLRKSPGFTAVAVLTLALGIGANTAIFSVVNAVLLSSLPYANADRLVVVKEILPNVGLQAVEVSGPDISLIQKLNHVFEGVAGFRVWTYEFSGSGEPERVVADRITSNLFRVLGVQPILGRAFTSEEEQVGHQVVILSYGMWQRRFGGDRNILGGTVNLDRQPYTIVGVMPQSFVLPLPGMSQGDSADLWVPLGLTKDELSDFGDNFIFTVVARLKPGIAITQANADLQLVAGGVLDTYAQWARDIHMSLGDFRLGMVSQPLGDEVTGPLRPTLLVLLGAVGFVLLIACVNVANLLMMRAVGRQKEMAVRLAIGAGRFRLLRQLLVEGMLLAFLGGALGLAMALWFKDVLVGSMPANIPRFHPISLNGGVLLFTFLVVAITGLAFGAFPAFWVSRTDLNPSLQDSGRGSSERAGHQRMRAVFVVAEVALSVVLLVGAGLLLRSFQRVLETDPGFRPEHVLTASIDLPPTEYTRDEQIDSFYRQLIDRLRNTQGMTAAGGSTDLPLLGGWTHAFTTEDSLAARGPGLNICNHSVIYGDYLQVMGVPLLRGRYFTDQDGPKSTHVLLVSESFAKKYWPNQDALGKRLKWGPRESNDPWLTIVGIVGDVKQGALDAATVPHTYEPYAQLGSSISLRIAVRGEGDPVSLAASLRATVWGLDRQLALGSVRSMNDVISRSTASRRFSVAIMSAFAALAVVLTAVGIYGVLAFSVARRTHEIGVRMALGAQHRDLLRLVVGQGILLVLIGTVIGIAAAAGLTRLMASQLFGVSAHDPLTFEAVAALLAIVALAACYTPARRAMRVDPMVALRYE